MKMDPVQSKFWPQLPVRSQNLWADLLSAAVGKGILVSKGLCFTACPEQSVAQKCCRRDSRWEKPAKKKCAKFMPQCCPTVNRKCEHQQDCSHWQGASLLLGVGFVWGMALDKNRLWRVGPCRCWWNAMEKVNRELLFTAFSTTNVIIGNGH